MFGRLFGPSTNQKPVTVDLNASIQQLRTASQQLEKREAYLENKIQQCLKAAKEKSKRRDKKGALYELKKKKQLDNQLQSIQGKKIKYRNSNYDIRRCSSKQTDIYCNENFSNSYSLHCQRR